MLKSFLNKFLGVKKEIESNKDSSNETGLKKKEDETLLKRIENETILVENCRRKVQARIEFYNQLKQIYNPSKDRKNSYTWSFMHNTQFMELRKVSLGYINDYQQKYKVKLPSLLIRILTEIGSGGFINTNLISYEGKVSPPYVCMEKEFLDKCLEVKIDPQIIDNGINEYYDFENNSFTHSGIQKVYKSLESNRDKYLVILFEIGHDASIVLNREDNRKLAISGVPGITNLSFHIGNKEYDSPYFKYDGGTLEGAICPLNESWWKKMEKDIINMNKEKEEKGS